MLLLSSLAFAHSPDPTTIGLAGIPETPDDARPAGTHASRMAAIRAGERPDMLVPCHFEARGDAYSSAWWHDGHGNVWTRAEAAAILARDPASAEAFRVFQREQVGEAVLLGVGLTVDVAAAVLAPPAAPLVIAGAVTLFGGGGFTLAMFARHHELDAVRAYNLAHAAPPPVGGVS
jgi:hypothetical protein